MKKLFTLLLAAAMVASFAACGQKENGTTTPAEGNTPAANTTGKEGETKASGKFIMATEAGFAPYEYVEGDTIIGVDVDIAQYIANELNMELEIMDVDFTNALLAPQQNKADFAAAGISITEERKESMDFTIEYASSKQVIVVKKGDTSITDEATMIAKTVGVQQGTTADLVYSDTEAYPGATVQAYKKYLVAADDLKNGKIDCIVMDELPAQMIIEQNQDLEILDVELFTDKYAFAVKKGNQELLDMINPILQELVDSGKIEEFTKKHMENAM